MNERNILMVKNSMNTSALITVQLQLHNCNCNCPQLQ